MYAELWKQNVSPQREAAASGPKNAVLLGAMSAISARAFHAQARHLYGMDNSCVIDLASGADKRRPENGSLLLSDALKPPFKEGSFRLAQTNFLLHMLTSPDNPARDEALAAFSDSTYRILAPGGHLVMCETIGEVLPFVNHTDSPAGQAWREAMEDDVRRNLATAGFTNIAIEPAWLPRDISYLTRHARQPSIPRNRRTVGWGAFSVYARKPEAIAM